MNSETFNKKLFGGEIGIIVYNPPDKIKEIIEGMYSEALRLQKIFNFFDPESELAILNKKRQMKVSKELLQVLKKSLKFAEFTGGRYDPALGKQILQRKERQNETNPDCSYKDLKISINKVTLRKPDVILDLGSIAKGYITDRLSEYLKVKGVKEFIINSRGDIAFSGNSEHVIGIQNPRNQLEALMKIRLKDQCVATSGDYMQFYGDFKKSHILNSANAISITVVAEKLEDADVIATALFVSDEKIRLEIINKYKKAKVLIVKKDLKCEYFNNFEDIVEK